MGFGGFYGFQEHPAGVLDGIERLSTLASPLWHTTSVTRNAAARQVAEISNRPTTQKAVGADALFVLPLVHLAGLALAASRNGEALELSARALRLNPLNLPRAWFYHCVASFDAGPVDAAEKSARRTIEEDKEHGFPRAEYLLGVVLARRGESAEAAAHLRSFLRLAPDGADAGRARQLAAEMERR